MKKTLIAMAVLGAASGFAMAASNVTLYGVIETGVVLQKAKHADTTVQMKSGFDQGSRWGIKGTEDLGNGYSVGFILEQGFNSDDGAEGVPGKQFNRESILNVKGGFGSLAFGRTGALSSGAQSQQILTGWALGTGFGLSAWNANTLGVTALGATWRMDNTVSYATPTFGGFSVHAMYSNGFKADDLKWSDNNHYYGLGLKYQEGAIKSSLVFEALDNKGVDVDADGVKTDRGEPLYTINYGLEYNLGSVTPMFAYRFMDQDKGLKLHKFGLSAKVNVAGGDALLGVSYLFGKNDAVKEGDDDVRSWNIGAAYIYPLSKRTAVKAYAGYADSGKSWKDRSKVELNGYQVYFGLRHSF